MSASENYLLRVELERKIIVAHETDIEIKFTYPSMNDFVPNHNHNLLRLLEQRKKLAEAYVIFDSAKKEQDKESILELFSRTNEMIKQIIGI